MVTPRVSRADDTQGGVQQRCHAGSLQHQAGSSAWRPDSLTLVFSRKDTNTRCGFPGGASRALLSSCCQRPPAARRGRRWPRCSGSRPKSPSCRPQRSADAVYLTALVPSTNVGGDAPGDVGGLEVYAATAEREPPLGEGDPGPPWELVQRLRVRRPVPPPPPAKAGAPAVPPLPLEPGVDQGQRVTLREALTAAHLEPSDAALPQATAAAGEADELERPALAASGRRADRGSQRAAVLRGARPDPGRPAREVEHDSRRPDGDRCWARRWRHRRPTTPPPSPCRGRRRPGPAPPRRHRATACSRPAPSGRPRSRPSTTSTWMPPRARPTPSAW